MIKQPEYREQIDHWVDAHAGQMLEDLKALVRIPSVKGEAKDGMPFGEMPAKAVSDAGADEAHRTSDNQL